MPEAKMKHVVMDLTPVRWVAVTMSPPHLGALVGSLVQSYKHIQELRIKRGSLVLIVDIVDEPFDEVQKRLRDICVQHAHLAANDLKEPAIG